MKKHILLTLLVIISAANAMAQYSTGNNQGMINDEVAWSFDGKTLTITNGLTKNLRKVNIPDYDQSNLSPWCKKKLAVKSVRIGQGIERIGSCAFYNCRELTEVVFEGNTLKEIGWGAFMNCSRLRTISLPTQMRKVETIAFANCISLPSVKIPDHCTIEDQAFVSCPEIKSIEVAPTATLGHYVFASELKIGGKYRHTLYDGEIRRLPAYVNVGNCHIYGFSKDAVNKYFGGNNTSASALVDYDYATSEIDTIIPLASTVHNNYYALIIGNQNYRFVPGVPYAIHDARIFKEYCEKTLGIPAENIHEIEDATKAMINEEEFQWLENISNRENKKLIVYYAGHGVPDTKDSNKAYMLPTDIRGTKPQNGISLDAFYGKLGELAFNQTEVFLDACFSGINRDNESVNEGMRGTEIAAEEATLGGGNVLVFSAAQGNETAQGYQEQGHGLFTYYLLKELNNYNGEETFGQMADNIKDNVSRTALQMKLQKPQTPSTNATDNIADMWRNMGF